MSAVEVVQATAEDRATVANLIQLCLYDMTDEGVWPVGADGRYEYGLLDRFWQHPYLLQVDGELAGFALVVDACPLTGERPCWFMAEFFVLRGYRRRGVGREAAAKLLRKHPGRWRIGVMLGHARSEGFWASVLEQVLRPEVSELDFEGDRWRLRDFTVKVA